MRNFIVRSFIVPMKVGAASALIVIAACTSFTPDAGVEDAGVDAGTADAATADAKVESAYAQLVLGHNPVAYWRMGSSQLPTVIDESGHGNQLTLQGAPTLGAPGAIANDPDTATFFDKSAIAAATDSRALDFAADAGTGNYSIELWVRPSPTTACPTTCDSQVLVQSLSGSVGYQVQIRSGDSGVPMLQFLHQSGPATVRQIPITKDVWSHVVATRDAARVVLYVNNVPSERTLATQPLSERTSTFRLGAGMTQDFFLGTLDEVALYDHAMTASEVAAHYIAGGL